jgi:hypothetical protein
MVQKKIPQESTRKGNKPQVPPQARKSSLVERLCKDVCKLILGRDTTQHNGPFLHIDSQEMIPHFYVFGSRMKHWVFAALMALVLSQRSGIWVHSSPKSLKVYEIHYSWEQQLAAATYSASVVDWATLDCLREDHETNEDQETDKNQK